MAVPAGYGLRAPAPNDLDVLVSHRGRGIRRVLVSVDAQNPTGATAVYERVGMRIVDRWDQWSARRLISGEA